MTTATNTAEMVVTPPTIKQSKSLWSHALSTILKDKLACTALIVVLIYFLIALLTFMGVIASNWGAEIGPSYAPPSADYLFGTDIFGRSVFLKMIKGAETAIAIGLATSIISLVIGTAMGAIAGYFGGLIDEAIVWFYTTFSSIPFIMLLISIAFIMGKGTTTVFISLGVTSWVSLCRIVRGEVMKHKEREYSQAASALGAGHTRKIFKHILPNISHVLIINFSLTFESAIKAEVILSYLGLGVQGRPSWGTMIDDSKLELARGVWWQLGAATLAMFFIVLAFNILGDALRDALDPKLKGK
ncbi:ABC transporter permease [Bacteriovorax sp. PP10]|uniref:ABC transporter permease n=1 Tax=Bacteriovorax antarcticus TaxID=3088717 RepID=A0ABU5VUC3_9BACT|nr:ABC transporter permease [Bacteriovorax sp. PP10]MEA9355245.1 ABC transporter permease [Bacteriovorax sp. PP10]